jgi:hypothetical protein
MPSDTTEKAWKEINKKRQAAEFVSNVTSPLKVTAERVPSLETAAASDAAKALRMSFP